MYRIIYDHDHDHHDSKILCWFQTLRNSSFKKRQETRSHRHSNVFSLGPNTLDPHEFVLCSGAKNVEISPTYTLKLDTELGSEQIHHYLIIFQTFMRVPFFVCLI